MSSFVAYRLPEAKDYVYIRSQKAPIVLSTYTELVGKEGFVVAPFAISESTPLLLIQPDSIETKTCFADNLIARRIKKEDEDPLSYHSDFQNFHAELINHHFQKIVLSRHVDVVCDTTPDPMHLFLKACALYPHQFICLVSTEQSGTWLMATPEILVEQQDNESPWHTMALAGTMRKDGPWDEKDCKEQEYVADYIEQCLADYATDIYRSQPYTRKAATLYHRCSDFEFRLKDGVSIGNVISALHPTPAVCGIPKHETQAFIMRNESHDREYYSGFCGPLQLNGSSHLFVSLRCMKLIGERCRLFSGGGLLNQSDEKHEWKETEYKLNTMMDVLR